MKIDCRGIILSFKDMLDVSAVLLQNASETTSPCLMPARHSATPRCI